ncbi:MAG TPA: PCRF domain-containing protein, partial [Longimicrobiales bacterium]
MKWEQRIPELLKRYDALTERLADPAIFSDPAALREVGREHAELTAAVEAARRLATVRVQLGEARELAQTAEEADLRELAQAEVESLSAEETEVAESLRQLLLPKDPLADRAAVLEIRAGTGGDEAGLFAGDLFRMYSRYAERK